MPNMIFLSSDSGYKGNMPQKVEKKSESVLLNLAPSTFADLTAIAAEHDRPVGYVARELMLRGLGLYRTDGRLKENAVHDAIGKALAKAIPDTDAPVTRHRKTQTVPTLKESAK
jgi:hypothetical protein